MEKPSKFHKVARESGGGKGGVESKGGEGGEGGNWLGNWLGAIGCGDTGKGGEGGEGGGGPDELKKITPKEAHSHSPDCAHFPYCKTPARAIHNAPLQPPKVHVDICICRCPVAKRTLEEHLLPVAGKGPHVPGCQQLSPKGPDGR